ncbi:hypothetical protein RBB83_13310 [Paenibacillus peoriae]|uniref:hypothetical protein n=1 Tax=Paenibacillus peoriae TaxID=59893 RepID=UPI0030CD2DA7
MDKDIKSLIEGIEKLRELGNGVLVVPLQNENELKKRVIAMQEYLKQRKNTG